MERSSRGGSNSVCYRCDGISKLTDTQQALVGLIWIFICSRDSTLDLKSN